MKKITLLISLLFAINIFSFSQKISTDFNISLSKPYRVIDAGSKEYITLDNDYALSVKTGVGFIYIQNFDTKNMIEVSRDRYSDLPRISKFQTIVKLKNKIFYIYQVYNRETKNITVYSREINTETAKFEAPKKLFTTSRMVAISSKYSNITKESLLMLKKKHRFLVYKSYDESKIMIKYRLSPIEKNNKLNYDELGFYVFDNNMEKLWGKEIKMPYTEAQIQNMAYAVSSKGKVLMLIANIEKQKYQLFTVDNDEFDKTDLSIPSVQMVRGMSIKENKNGNFICGGFYSNNEKPHFSNGVIYFVIDDDGDILNSELFNFTEDFINQNNENANNKGIPNLSLIKFIVKDDGSAYFIGEQQWIEIQVHVNAYSYGIPSQSRIAHLNDVIMVKVNNEGELDWMTKIVKNQISSNGIKQMGINYIEGEYDDYVVYVDNPKNISLNSDEIPFACKKGLKSVLTISKIDHETGNVEKNIACKMDDIKGYVAYQFRPERVFKAESEIFLMEVYIKHKRDIMVKFE